MMLLLVELNIRTTCNVLVGAGPSLVMNCVHVLLPKFQLCLIIRHRNREDYGTVCRLSSTSAASSSATCVHSPPVPM